MVKFIPNTGGSHQSTVLRSRLRKIARMSILCYKNAFRLHQDSIYLYKRRSYPSANALSIIAIEEMGKYQSLSHALFYGFFEGDNDEEFIAGFLKDMYDHRMKQRVFLNQSWHDVMYADMQRLKKKHLDYDTLYQRFMGKRPEPNFDDPEFRKYFPNMRKHYRQLHGLESLKQNSLYVGFPRKRGAGSDFSVKLHSPFRIGRRTAENQITTLNDHLLIEALGVLKGTSGFEAWEEELTVMITPKYVRQLRKNWPWIATKNRATVEKLSQLPDDQDSDP
jgi:AbiV family abortive infection protein